jgi:hypothetical protein
MTRHRAPLLVLFTATLACSDGTAPRALPDGVAAARGPSGPTPRYKLRFVSGFNESGDGEIQSGWFPDTGVVLNTRAPWKSLSVRGATIDLVNSTHGRWNEGTCATLALSVPINVTSWDIASTTLSFAGRWFGTLSISRTTGTSIGFDGDRVVDGIVTPGAGGIHNVVTNANAPYETRDPSGKGDWFRLDIRDAALKFGSASTPDGFANPSGAEVACANFSILAMKAELIVP